MRTCGLVCIFLFYLGPCLGEEAQPDSVSSLVRHIRPDPPGRPTHVVVNIYLIDIKDLNDLEESIQISYFLSMRWRDIRLADANFPDPRDKLNLTMQDIWNPGITPVNEDFSTPHEQVLRIDEEGNVVFRERRTDTFSINLDLRRFPFDKQVLKLNFLSTLYGTDQLDIVWSPEGSGHVDSFSVSSWNFLDFDLEKADETLKMVGGNEFSVCGLKMTIHAERNSGFYIWKVFLPLGLIVFMSMTVFWIDPSELSGQLSVSSASVLTLIAFQLSLVELQPKISYLTRIDFYAIGSSLLVFFALGESILTARLARLNKHKQAVKIDRVMRWTFPLAFMVLTLLTCL